MFRNIHYDYKTSTIHLWHTINGERMYDEIPWVPYVFLKDPSGDIETIDGQLARKKTFKTYWDKSKFEKGISRNIFENQMSPVIQFLAERYHGIPDDSLEVPDLKIYTIDIEVAGEGEFPDFRNPIYPITCITIHDTFENMFHIFGVKKFTGDLKGKNFKFYESSNDEGLLDNIIDFMSEEPPDIITGWNIAGFDIPYIVERARFLHGNSDKINKISPIGKLNTWITNEGKYTFDIPGMSWIDYLDLYKGFSGKNLQNYKLDTVAQEELGVGKLDFSEYGSGASGLKKMFEVDWNKYVEYNVEDVDRVKELEQKKKFIQGNVQGLALLCKTPLMYYTSQTKLIEGALVVYFRRNNMCAPYKAEGNIDPYKGAVVKDPITGFYDFVIDIDITSSYPSHVITLNMSTETYYGRIMTTYNDDDEKYYLYSTDMDNTVDVVSCVIKQEFPSFKLRTSSGIRDFDDDLLEKFNAALKRKLFSIAPCGTVFINNRPGVIATVQRQYFAKRKETKTKMKDLRKKAAKLPKGEEKTRLTTRADQLNAFQIALKTILNSTYGATAVPYSRYFNPDISLAITSCGYHTILEAERYANEFMNSKTNTERDYVLYGDTDSLYIGIGLYFDDLDLQVDNSNWRTISDDDKIELVLKHAKEIQDNVNDRTFNETQLQHYNSDVHDFKVELKQEVVAKTALFIKKKRYAYWVVNEEGVPVDKVKVKGIEIIRSDTPTIARKYLQTVLEMIMKSTDDDEIQNKINDFKKEMLECPVEEIAANVGINNLSKYVKKDNQLRQLKNIRGGTLGIPWHIKGAVNYRTLRSLLKLEADYEDVMNDDKVCVVYLKKNPFNFDTLSFISWPEIFEEHGIVPDRDKMIEKYFLKKIGMLLDPINKEHLLSGDASNSIESFFV